MKKDLTWITRAFSTAITILLVGCLYLVGNFLVGQLHHELVDPLIKSSDHSAKQVAGITLQAILMKLVLYQLSYFVLSFAIAFSFRSLGAVVVGVLIPYQYLFVPIVTYSMPISAVDVWSQFISNQMATVSGAMLGLHMRNWEKKVVGSHF